MNFPAEFRADLMARPADADTAKGLELVEERVTKVIKAIETELTTFKPKDFETAGEIRETSFGAADRSSVLALHHRRAHAVTVATLTGVKKDLEEFRQACTDARMFVQEADRNAADQVILTRKAVDRLVQGSASDHGDTANNQAQQSGVGSEPTPDPSLAGTDTGDGSTGGTP